MQKVECYKAEVTQTKTGKTLKKLVLQESGAQYPMKNVTLWANHPLYEDIEAGWSGELEIETKDSEVPNPHGGFYKNRTVIDPSYQGAQKVMAEPKPPTPAHEANALNFQVVPLLKEIKAMVGAMSDRLDVFIDADNIQPNFNKPKVAEEDVDDSNPF